MNQSSRSSEWRPTGFVTLEALEVAHHQLMARLEQEGDFPSGEFLDDVRSFLERGRATGVVLGPSAERVVAQERLDFWVARLARLEGGDVGDVALAPFDRARASFELSDDDFPYTSAVVQRIAGGAAVGTERLVGNCLKRLRDDNLLVIEGNIGGGRTSVLEWGVVPALRRDELAEDAGWRFPPCIVPGSQPLAQLADAFARLAAEDPRYAALAAGLRQDPPVVPPAETQLPPCLLVVDNFECLGGGAKAVSAAQLLGLLHALSLGRQPWCRVALISNAGLFEGLALPPEQRARFEKASVYVSFFPGELRTLIEMPASFVGLRFEEGVVSRLVDDVLGDPACISLLSFTLRRLWRRRERNWITWQTYREIGGGRLAMRRAAEEVYERLRQRQLEDVCRRVLMMFVEPGAGQEVQLRTLTRESLAAAGDANKVNEVVGCLLDVGLLSPVTSDSPEASADRLKMSTALLSHWGRLQDWLGERRDQLRRRIVLRAAIETWRAGANDVGGLWTSWNLINEASQFNDPPLTDEEQAFLRASREAVEAAEQEKDRQLRQAKELAEERQRNLQVSQAAAKELNRKNRGLLFWLASAIVLAVLLFWQSRIIQKSFLNEQMTRREEQDRAADLRVAQGWRAWDADDAGDAVAWFHAAAEKRTDARRDDDDDRLRVASAFRHLPQLTALHRVDSVKNKSQFSEPEPLFFSADGTLLIGITDASQLLVVRLADAQQVTFESSSSSPVTKVPANRVLCSHDSDWLVSVAAETRADAESSRGKEQHRVTVWRRIRGAGGDRLREEKVLRFATDVPVVAVSDSSHARTPESAGAAAAPQIVIVTSTGSPARSAPAVHLLSQGPTKDWSDIVLNESGAMAPGAVIAADEIAAVAWSEATRRLALLRVLRRAPAKPSLSQAVTSECRLEIWEEQRDQPTSTPAWSKIIESPSLSANDAGRGSRLSFGRGDPNLLLATVLKTDEESGTVFLWDIRGGRNSSPKMEMPKMSPGLPPGVLLQKSSGRNAVLSADCDRYVVGTERQAVIWSVDREALSEARRLRDALGDDFARNAYAAVVRPFTELDHGTSIFSATFSPDGRYVATGGRGGVARVWDLVTGRPAFPQIPHNATVNQVAFSADGHELLTVDGRKTVIGRRWSLRTVAPVTATLDVPSSPKLELLSPDGRYVATAHAPDDSPSGGGLIVIRDWSAADGNSPGGEHPSAEAAAEESGPVERRVERIELPNREIAASLAWWQNESSAALIVISRLPRVRDLSGATETAGAITGTDAGDSPLPVRVRWYDIGSATPPSVRFTAQSAHDIRWACVSGDGRRLALVRETLTQQIRRGQARVWDVAELVRDIPAGAAAGEAFPDECWNRAGDSPIWETPANSNPQLASQSHREGITALTLTRDGEFLITASTDDAVRLWALNPVRSLETLAEHSANATGVALSADEQWLATCSADGNAHLWPLTRRGGELRVNVAEPRSKASGTKQVLEPKVILDHKAAIAHVAWDANLQQVLTSGADGTLKLWRWEQSRPRLELTLSHPGPLLQSASFSGPNRIVAIGAVLARRERSDEDGASTPAMRHLVFWSRRGDIVDKDQLKQTLAREFDDKSVTIRPIKRSQLGPLWRGPDPEAQFGSDQNLLWHVRQARDSEIAKMWSTAGWHLSELLSADLRDRFDDAQQRSLLLRRAIARRNSDHLEDAERDLTEAIERSSGNDSVALRLRAEVLSKQARQLDGTAAGDSTRSLELLKRIASDYLKVVKIAEENGLESWKDHLALAEAYAEQHVGATLSDANLEAARLQLAQAWNKVQQDHQASLAEAARVSYRLALLQLTSDDTQGYRQTIKRMSELFPGGADPEAVRLFAWTCSLSNDAVSDTLTWDDVREASERALRPTKFDDLNTYAAVLYRSEDDKYALNVLEKAVFLAEQQAQASISDVLNSGDVPLASTARVSLQGTPYDLVFLALTHGRLARSSTEDSGHRDKADAYRDDFLQWLASNVKSSQSAVRQRIPWYARLEFLLLEKELNAAVRTTPGSP